MDWKETIKKCIPDKWYLKRFYKKKMGKPLNLTNPIGFNEKLQWLKLYDRKPEYTQMVDKYEAKEYIGKIIGEKYIIPTLGVWEKFDDIDFDLLPNQFVLKCTHDSGGLVICQDKQKFDKIAAKEKIQKSLRRNYYWAGREWPYKNIKPRIIAEKFMSDDDNEFIKKQQSMLTEGLTDYKFMCFNGKVKCSFVCSDRFSEKGLHVTFFDRDWNLMPFRRCYPSYDNILPKPINYEKMLELAEKLSAGIPFVRVDFYESSGKIYFGELTFYPGGGFEAFSPEEWDYILGDWIKLPSLK